MGDRANFVLLDGNRAVHGPYVDKYGAVGLDLALLAGPARTVERIRALGPGGYWLDDVFCQGAVLVDLPRRVLLFFAWEGPSTDPRLRAAVFALLREAWPGWEVRWCLDGNADLLRYLGRDPETVRDRDVRPVVAPPLSAEWEVAAEESALVVVTVGPSRSRSRSSSRCHLLADIGDHPATEGPALLQRLDGATDFSHREVAADAGLHLDPERRTLGWWTLTNLPDPDAVPARWPGWTVHRWDDDPARHLAAVPGLFALPEVDPGAARAAVLRAAENDNARRAGRS
ncbi:hypothetical protein HUT16_15090 [Kitasatospora sp. NA04385]|uniref:hypothetical protein n=1 Tax=Kitasatospora sp. NA04385 TaxID=2742135 RepID=UPI00159131E4|nr:hypothetical protein [Kitasatospora sp. NA04385]QKW20218.1 hypothetical protein HUT16_15090 [Kitasatospora sp. NA04385]